MTHILTSCHSSVVRVLESCPAILGSNPRLVEVDKCEGNFLKVYPNGLYHMQMLAGKQDKGVSPLATPWLWTMTWTRGSLLYSTNQQRNPVRISNAYNRKTPASPHSRQVPTHVHIRFIATVKQPLDQRVLEHLVHEIFICIKRSWLQLFYSILTRYSSCIVLIT